VVAISKAKIDGRDIRIIQALKEDARTSFRRIARELDVSPDTVIGRYRRMVAGGVIKGSTAVVDPKRLGYEGMAAFHIDMAPSSSRGERASKYSSLIMDSLIGMPNIIVVTRTVGDHDLLAIGVVFGVNHLMGLCDEIGKIPSVKDLQVSIWDASMEVSPRYFII
jgi:DNA-binding Lrp family transcriptional regulator